MKKIDICSTCDALYLKHLAVSLCSLKTVAPDSSIHFHYLKPKGIVRGVAAFERFLEARGLEVTIMEGPGRFAPELREIYRNRRARYVSAATLNKIFLPQCLAPRVKRVLYVDPDTIFTADPEPLFAERLQGCVVGACLDMPAKGEWLPCTLETGYFNAGMMLIDVPRWLESDVPGQALAAASRLKGINRSTDQDIFNVVLNGQWHPLPGNWNLQVGARQFYAGAGLSPSDKGLFHFTGPTKPWLYKRASPFDALYLQAARAAGYPCRTFLGRPVEDNMAQFVPRALAKMRHWAEKCSGFFPAYREAG